MFDLSVDGKTVTVLKSAVAYIAPSGGSKTDIFFIGGGTLRVDESPTAVRAALAAA